MNKLMKLEGLRGLSALYMVVYHTYGYYKPLIIGGIDFTFFTQFGECALISFFVLSGIVISISYETAKDQSFKYYFCKRFFRIYIPLFFVFIANYLIFSFYNKGFIEAPTWQQIVGNLLMVQDIQRENVFSVTTPMFENAPLWTLSHEWWFYMIYFFIMKYFRKHSTNVATGLFIAGAIVHIIFPSTFSRLLMLMSIWWIGVAIGRLYMSKKQITLKELKMPLLGYISCMIITGINMWLNTRGITQIYPLYDLTFFANGLLVLIIGFIWYKLKWVGYNKIFRIFIPAAGFSYVIYISHWFMICWAKYLDDIIPYYPIRYIAYIVITIVFSYTVEKIFYPPINKFLMRKIFPQKFGIKAQ